MAYFRRLFSYPYPGISIVGGNLLDPAVARSGTLHDPIGVALTKKNTIEFYSYSKVTVFICSVTHNIEKYTPMNSSPVLLLLGFLEAQTSKRSARKFFSRHFSVQISEWASFISFTQFRLIQLSGFFKPRRANGVLANFFPDNFPSKLQSGLPS